METANLARYERIAPFYDLLDRPFERWRYRAIRPLLFRGMVGNLLDAGLGTGRNCEFYPPGADVSGIDISPARRARAQQRCPSLAVAGRLYRMNVTELTFPNGAFTGAVATFLCCVLPGITRDFRSIAGARPLEWRPRRTSAAVGGLADVSA